MFIFAMILFILAVVALAIWLVSKRGAKASTDRYETDSKSLVARIAGWSAAALAALGLVLAVLNSFFIQDPGQANVLRSWDGSVVGYETTEGFHWKAPWVDTVTFDIRNQRVVYTGGESNGDNSGGESDGPQITVQDKDGVTTNVDLSVTYSIAPQDIVPIYRGYKDETGLKTKLINNDIRSLSRIPFTTRSTLETLTDRAAIADDIAGLLKDKWAEDGVIVNDVSLLEVRPPQAVVESYAAAQQAQINVATEQAKLDAAKVSSQTQIVQAEAKASADIAAAKGTAEANRLVNASLTPQILQQRMIEAYGEGTVFVVPEGSNPLITTGK